VKYMMNGGYGAHPLMRLTLGCTLLFVAGLWATNVFLFVTRMGFTPESIARYYLGSEAEFLPPRTAGSMLEVTHAHLAMMAMVLLLVTHLAIFLPWSMRVRILLVLGTFGSALLQEGSGWLVRFVHPAFAWLKIGSFLGLQAGLLILVVGLARHLATGPGRASGGPDPAAGARPLAPQTDV